MPGDSFPIGDTLVTYTVTDTSGNQTQGTFGVSVSDNEAPSIAGLPPTLTVEVEATGCGATVTWDLPVITDNCMLTSSSASQTPGVFLPVGVTIVTYDAEDSAGNQTSATLVITVTDSEGPTIGPVPAAIVVSNDLGQCGANVSWTPPTVSDSCVITSFTSTHQPGDFFPVGLTTVFYTATDENGNVTTEPFSVTVTDGENPTLAVGSDVFANVDPGTCSGTVTVTPPFAADNCAIGSVINDYNGTGDASDNYPLGTTMVTWIATDASGNQTSQMQAITVDFAGGDDCNANGIPDACELLEGTVEDCNENGVPDECDISLGTSSDVDGNNVPDECDANFTRGDANDDGTLNIADAIFLLTNLFVGGPAPVCLDAGDTNDDGFIDISDVITAINYIFVGGAAPPAPFPNCGIDPTADALDCAGSVQCP